MLEGDRVLRWIHGLHQLKFEHLVHPDFIRRDQQLSTLGLHPHLNHLLPGLLALLGNSCFPLRFGLSVEFNWGLLAKFSIWFLKLISDLFLQLRHDSIDSFEAFIHLLVLTSALRGVSGANKVGHLFEDLTHSDYHNWYLLCSFELSASLLKRINATYLIF